MIYDHVLAYDPSGNYEEGAGTTGTCLFDAQKRFVVGVHAISANNYASKEDYWQEHIDFLEDMRGHFPNVILVMEDFTLDPKRALQQSHSRMETPKLIGILQLYCAMHKIPYAMQLPSEVKTRWEDHILVHKGILIQHHKSYYLPGHTEIVNRHCKDAIRHAVHYATFKNQRLKK